MWARSSLRLRASAARSPLYSEGERIRTASLTPVTSVRAYNAMVTSVFLQPNHSLGSISPWAQFRDNANSVPLTRHSTISEPRDDGDDDNFADDTVSSPKIRLSKLIATQGENMQMSRRSAERLISDYMVTVAGKVVIDPSYFISIEEASSGGGIVKVAGRLLKFPNSGNKRNSAKSERGSLDQKHKNDSTEPKKLVKVWLAHKLKAEVVAENDDKPSLMDRLVQSGVGKPKKKSQQTSHLKPIGRLDMMTEGLMVITNDGHYARMMELPSSKFHRTYRARVHGMITERKLRALRSGMTIDGTRYKGMEVSIEMPPRARRRRERSANTWLRVTCAEGKNRQVRKTLDHLGLTVSRLIRISFGDYDLNTIPPGMAIEVPVKDIEKQKKKGQLMKKYRSKSHARHDRVKIEGEVVQPIQWIKHI